MRIADFFDNSESLWPLCVFIRIPANPPNRKLILSWRISRRRQAKKQSLTRCFTRATADCRCPKSNLVTSSAISYACSLFVHRSQSPATRECPPNRIHHRFHRQGLILILLQDQTSNLFPHPGRNQG